MEIVGGFWFAGLVLSWRLPVRTGRPFDLRCTKQPGRLQLLHQGFLVRYNHREPKLGKHLTRIVEERPVPRITLDNVSNLKDSL